MFAQGVERFLAASVQGIQPAHPFVFGSIDRLSDSGWPALRRVTADPSFKTTIRLRQNGYFSFATEASQSASCATKSRRRCQK
jgi:hypothetical protein